MSSMSSDDESLSTPVESEDGSTDSPLTEDEVWIVAFARLMDRSRWIMRNGTSP